MGSDSRNQLSSNQDKIVHERQTLHNYCTIWSVIRGVVHEDQEARNTRSEAECVTGLLVLVNNIPVLHDKWYNDGFII